MTPNAAQIDFLQFHARQTPTEWRWHMQGALLLVRNERGRFVTIGARDFGALLEAGLIVRGAGCADCAITNVGRDTLYLESVT